MFSSDAFDIARLAYFLPGECHTPHFVTHGHICPKRLFAPKMPQNGLGTSVRPDVVTLNLRTFLSDSFDIARLAYFLPGECDTPHFVIHGHMYHMWPQGPVMQQLFHCLGNGHVLYRAAAAMPEAEVEHGAMSPLLYAKYLFTTAIFAII